MQYNEGQIAAIKRIVEVASSPASYNQIPGITLIGEGGTGKTTCIMDAVSQLISQGFKVLMAAPTNKAVKQLTKSAKSYGLDLSRVGFSTVHGALGLAMLPNEEKRTAFRAGPGEIMNYDVIVIDEASMLGRYLLADYLIPELEANGSKVILMGDDKQLPPVMEKVSPCFELFETVRLTKVERFDANSGIADLVSSIRKAIDEDSEFESPDQYGAGITTVLPAKFPDLLREHFQPGVDLDDKRVLAWSNKRVNQLNDIIRESIYGKKPDRFYPDERVVTGSPIKNGDHIVLGTDEECRIIQCRVSEVEDLRTGQVFKSHQLILEPIYVEPKKRIAVHVVHEDEQDDYEEELSRLRRLAMKGETREERKHRWARYWQFAELSTDIRYAACITVHRSQGSTFDQVFVDVKDIIRNRTRSERQRLLCVATSRPRSHLYLSKGDFMA